MTKRNSQRSGGGKLSRSETVTVRLDPKLRYLAELAALKQRRTLSSFIEWAVDDALKRLPLRDDHNGSVTIADEAPILWDVAEPDRFIKLALRYPELLDHEQQKLWKIIRESAYLWLLTYDKVHRKWSWAIDDKSVRVDRLRTHWKEFCSVADGSESENILPKEPDPVDWPDDTNERRKAAAKTLGS
ncbi:MAG: hypothetical protein EXR82_09350 [Gammaproteobacteria bacterium]|nr:hypothetical protein [Gammaproteobacteria bacterium]